MQQAVEAILTPAHPHPFETLLDQPFAGALHHPTSQRQAQLFEFLVADVVTMFCQIVVHVLERMACSVRQLIQRQRGFQFFEDGILLSVTKLMAGDAKPVSGAAGATIQPGAGRFPQVLRGVVEIQNADSLVFKPLAEQAPKAAPTITDPGNRFCRQHTLSQRFQPQTRREGVNIPQHCHQATSFQAGDCFPSPVGVALQPSQDRYLTSRQRVRPLGLFFSGRKGTITPSAPANSGRCANAGTIGSISGA